MASNSFGNSFRFTTWGESHGKAIGCVIDGVPSNIELDEKYIQNFLDKRKPNQSEFASSRKEADRVEILSGIFEGKTTGAPISTIIYNIDQKSSDYNEFKGRYRSGHGDYVYEKKYGIRDHRGGGRSSARETACRVIAGAVARKIIGSDVIFESSIREIGGIKVREYSSEYLKTNSLYCPDQNIIGKWKNIIKKAIDSKDSLGGIGELRIKNLLVGIGEPIYKKLSAKLGEAVLSINSIKGVEFGLGFNASHLRGSEYIDSLEFSDDNPVYSSNNSGGIDAGISNGQDIIIRFVAKPPSSIKSNLIGSKGSKKEVLGRFDSTTIIRAIPVVEAMCACVIADLMQEQL